MRRVQAGAIWIDYSSIHGKSRLERDPEIMRGLATALFALDFPGPDRCLRADCRAGRMGAPFLFLTATTGTITKKTTAKTV